MEEEAGTKTTSVAQGSEQPTDVPQEIQDTIGPAIPSKQYFLCVRLPHGMRTVVSVHEQTETCKSAKEALQQSRTACIFTCYDLEIRASPTAAWKKLSAETKLSDACAPEGLSDACELRISPRPYTAGEAALHASTTQRLLSQGTAGLDEEWPVPLMQSLDDMEEEAQQQAASGAGAQTPPGSKAPRRPFSDVGPTRLHAVKEVLMGRAESPSKPTEADSSSGALSAASQREVAAARADTASLQRAADTLGNSQGMQLPDPLADHVRTPGELLQEARAANRLAAALSQDVPVPGLAKASAWVGGGAAEGGKGGDTEDRSTVAAPSDPADVFGRIARAGVAPGKADAAPGHGESTGAAWVVPPPLCNPQSGHSRSGPGAFEVHAPKPAWLTAPPKEREAAVRAGAKGRRAADEAVEKAIPTRSPGVSMPTCPVRSLRWSPFNPPPANRRAAGDLAYFVAETAEGASVHITATSSGFHADRSDVASGTLDTRPVILQVRKRVASSGTASKVGGKKKKRRAAEAAARQEAAESVQSVALASATLPGLLALVARGLPQFMDAASRSVRDSQRRAFSSVGSALDLQVAAALLLPPATNSGDSGSVGAAVHPHTRSILSNYVGFGAGAPVGVIPGAPFIQSGLQAGIASAPAEWLEPCDAPWCAGGNTGKTAGRPQPFLHWLRMATDRKARQAVAGPVSDTPAPRVYEAFQRAAAAEAASCLSGFQGKVGGLNGAARLEEGAAGEPVGSVFGVAGDREVASASLSLVITGRQSQVEHEEDQGIGSQILQQMTEQLEEALVGSIHARAASGEAEAPAGGYEPAMNAVRKGLKTTREGLLAAGKQTPAVGATAASGPLGGGMVCGFQVRDFNGDFIAALQLPCLSTVGRLVMLRSLWKIRRDFAEAAVRAAVAVSSGQVRQLGEATEDERLAVWSLGGLEVRRAVSPEKRWSEVQALLSQAWKLNRAEGTSTDEIQEHGGGAWPKTGNKCPSTADEAISAAALAVQATVEAGRCGNVELLLALIRSGAYRHDATVPFLGCKVSVGGSRAYIVTVPRNDDGSGLVAAQLNKLPLVLPQADHQALQQAHESVEGAGIAVSDSKGWPLDSDARAARLQRVLAEATSDPATLGWLATAYCTIGSEQAALFAPLVPATARVKHVVDAEQRRNERLESAVLTRLRSLLPLGTFRQVMQVIRQRTGRISGLEAEAHDADCELQGASEVIRTGSNGKAKELATEVARSVWSRAPSVPEKSKAMNGSEATDSSADAPSREVARQVFAEHCRCLEQELLDGFVLSCEEDGVPRTPDGALSIDSLTGLSEGVLSKYGVSEDPKLRVLLGLSEWDADVAVASDRTTDDKGQTEAADEGGTEDSAEESRKPLSPEDASAICEAVSLVEAHATAKALRRTAALLADASEQASLPSDASEGGVTSRRCSKECRDFVASDSIPKYARAILSGARTTVDCEAVVRGMAPMGIPAHMLGELARAIAVRGSESDSESAPEAASGAGADAPKTDSVGKVGSLLPGAQWAFDLVEAEMVARTAAGMLQQLLDSSIAIRECPAPAVAAFFNCLVGGMPATDGSWRPDPTGWVAVAAGIASACGVRLPIDVAKAINRPGLAESGAKSERSAALHDSAASDEDVVFQAAAASLADLLDPEGGMELADIEHGSAGDVVACAATGPAAAATTAGASSNTTWPAGARCLQTLLSLSSNGALRPEAVWSEIQRRTVSSFNGYKLQTWTGPTCRGAEARLALLRRICQLSGVRLRARAFDLDSTAPLAAADVAAVVPVIDLAGQEPSAGSARNLLDGAKESLSAGQAEEAFQLAFDATQQVLAVCDGSHVDFVEALRLLHKALAAGGDVPQAIVAAQRAVVAAERLCGIEAPETAATYSELARSLARGGDAVGTVECWQRALALTRLAAGDNSNPVVAEMLLRSAEDALQMGHAAWTQEACKAALAVRPPDVDTYASVPILELLARASATVGQFKDATETQSKAAAVLAELVGDPEDPVVQRARFEARLYRSRGASISQHIKQQQAAARTGAAPGATPRRGFGGQAAGGGAKGGGAESERQKQLHSFLESKEAREMLQRMVTDAAARVSKESGGAEGAADPGATSAGSDQEAARVEGGSSALASEDAAAAALAAGIPDISKLSQSQIQEILQMTQMILGGDGGGRVPARGPGEGIGSAKGTGTEGGGKGGKGGRRKRRGRRG